MRWPPTLFRRTLTAGVPVCESKNEVAFCNCSPEVMMRLFRSTGSGLPSEPMSLP